MTREEIFKELECIFHHVFSDHNFKLSESMTANDVEEWDSLNHIDLVVKVEKRFGFKFKVAEITGMKNVGEMVDIIEKRQLSK